MKIIEFYERALTGKRMEEKAFDIEVLPRKLKELVKKHDIFNNPDEVVPQDLDMAKRTFNAAIELLLDVGIYCKGTNSIITIEEEEIKNALGDVPSSYVVGEGAEAVDCYCRGVGDSRKPRIVGGLSGAPVSEENYIKILTGYAQEPIDVLHTGPVHTLFGKEIRAKTPIEFLVCKYEALWAREAVRRAGKPGLGILGIMSGITSEAQNAGDFEGGLRPCDMHCCASLNELKVDWDYFNKIIHNQYLGNIIQAAMGGPQIGGYCGGPEGSAITAVAEAIQGYVMSKPKTFAFYAINLVLGVPSDRWSIWVACMTSLALQSAAVPIILGTYVAGAAGPCTEMLCSEIAAQSIAHTASGMSILYGPVGCAMNRMDYFTPMETRILGETSRAAAGMKLSDANEIVKELLAKYEETLKSRKAPQGKNFHECYDVKRLVPSEEYVTLWERERKELEKMGLVWS